MHQIEEIHIGEGTKNLTIGVYTNWMLMEDMKRKLENWKLLLFTAGAEESDE